MWVCDRNGNQTLASILKTFIYKTIRPIHMWFLFFKMIQIAIEIYPNTCNSITIPDPKITRLLGF